MPQVFDRFTVNFYGPEDVRLAEQFRKVVGPRQINRVLKELMQDYVKQRHAKEDTTPKD